MRFSLRSSAKLWKKTGWRYKENACGVFGQRTRSMGATTLPSTRVHVTRYPFTSSFMRRGTVNWSQKKLAFSLQWVLLIDKSWRSSATHGGWSGDCLSGHYVWCAYLERPLHSRFSSFVPDYHRCESDHEEQGGCCCQQGGLWLIFSGNTLVAGSAVVTVLTLMKM